MRNGNQIWKSFVLMSMLLSVVLIGSNLPGLNFTAQQELSDAGVDKYLGEFEPVLRPAITDVL